jgi:hypothetical protein
VLGPVPLLTVRLAPLAAKSQYTVKQTHSAVIRVCSENMLRFLATVAW